ncbi:hypothetical protein RI129_008178 [Pyrocoelia pectoralis]|uniref:Dehydrogenase/reductase SDR family member 4 n=1 Tax=Pyrocoelia pectoralis TaxID=417401 RepID=A0AAN7VAN2_9COLE
MPNMRFDGKVAIVTASTDGIGFAIAKRLAQEGAKVVISSRNKRNVDKAVAQLSKDGLGQSVVGIVCHVAKEEDRTRLFNEAINIGGLDILISNAAVNPSVAPFHYCTEKEWDKIFEVNVKASFLLSKAAVPFFRKRGGGRIVFLSSISGQRHYKVTIAFTKEYILFAFTNDEFSIQFYSSLQYMSVYGVSKTALFGLTKALSLDVANDKITVNCIAPGIIQTNFVKRVSLIFIARNVVGTTEEIATVAAFLASDDSCYITGEIITVSGGIHSRL